MSTENLTTPGATALRTSFAEAAIVAEDADWDAARAAFNLLQDQRPAVGSVDIEDVDRVALTGTVDEAAVAASGSK